MEGWIALDSSGRLGGGEHRALAPRHAEGMAMTTTHERSICIDAPVEKVFAHVEDPRRFYSALASRMEVGDLTAPPDRVGTSFDWSVPYVLGLKETGVMTRLEYVANERIVDKSSKGWVWTVMTEPDNAGTKLTFHAEESSKIPLLDKIDAAVFRVGRQLERTLATLKEQIEADQQVLPR